MAGLWVFKDDLTRERCLGAVAAVAPGIISIEAVEEYLLDTGKDADRARAARDAYEATLRRIKVVNPDQGIDWPHEIPVLPKWHEFEEGGVAIPAVKRGFKLGPRGQNRNDGFKHGTSKTERPVVRFDLCIKCTLCWADCPDECFDPTDDGLYDINYEVCTGCHKCADVCPVKECIVMVPELQFEDEKSPWEQHKKDPAGYIQWAEDKKGSTRIRYRHVTGEGVEKYKATPVPRNMDGPGQKEAL